MNLPDAVGVLSFGEAFLMSIVRTAMEPTYAQRMALQDSEIAAIHAAFEYVPQTLLAIASAPVTNLKV